jgi:hypothetical protein
MQLFKTTKTKILKNRISFFDNYKTKNEGHGSFIISYLMDFFSFLMFIFTLLVHYRNANNLFVKKGVHYTLVGDNCQIWLVKGLIKFLLSTHTLLFKIQILQIVLLYELETKVSSRNYVSDEFDELRKLEDDQVLLYYDIVQQFCIKNHPSC